MVFNRAKAYQDTRRVTEYELTEKLIRLLEAEKAHIQAHGSRQAACSPPPVSWPIASASGRRKPKWTANALPV